LNIIFENINFNSPSGPNSFARKLRHQLINRNNSVKDLISADFKPDVQLSFISSNVKLAPIVQRLDGIYFNTDQDYDALNSPIERTYDNASAIVFQSDFNKSLIEHWFGVHENAFVIRNGSDIDFISKIEPMQEDTIDKFENVWSCSSSWRPHKRLGENIRYFLEFSKDDDCLIVAGENPDVAISHPRVFYAGHLSYDSLISLYKRSKYFLHLAWLDHCPNVVIDARAAGAHVICSSSGGTSEIAGKNSTIVEEDKWDFSPIRLYSPPSLDFSKKYTGVYESHIDMSTVCDQYIEVFSEVIMNNK